MSAYSGGEYISGIDSKTEDERINQFLADFQLDKEQIRSIKGHVDQVINDRTAQLHNPIIVLGSRANTGFTDNLVGHTAEKVINSACHNVLVFKSNR